MKPWMALLMLLAPLPAACGGGDDGPTMPDAQSPKQYGSIIKVTLAATDVPNTPQTWSNSLDIDTDSSMCKTPIDPAPPSSYCVIAYTTITLMSTATLRAHGSKPLVLLATQSFDLEGMIDVSSKQGSPGAGANPATGCQGTAATGHSGGYGGSFGGKGGNGGQPLAGTGEAAGVAAMPFGALPAALRGGCPGGAGVMGSGMGGAGGPGGGAVAIISPSVTVNGKINASGAGGRGGPLDATMSSGAGGGGSGGMIVIDTSTISPPVSAAPDIWLFANGGGGGQGGTGTGIGVGAGDDGRESMAPMSAALGGANGNRSGGSGGDGSAGVSKAGIASGNAVNSGGGGAGGGGAGFIHTPAIDKAVIAPPPT